VCAGGHFQTNGRCFDCGSVIQQQEALTGTIVLAVSLLLLLSAAIVTLSPSALAKSVRAFCLLQVVALNTLHGVSDMPSAGGAVTLAAAYFNLINFDVEVLRPGCSGQRAMWCAHGACALRVGVPSRPVSH
jgi:hypothetical protein